MSGKNQGKIGNFEVDDKWQSWSFRRGKNPVLQPNKYSTLQIVGALIIECFITQQSTKINYA